MSQKSSCIPQESPCTRVAEKKSTCSLTAIFSILWSITESDFWTFVIPDTLFGVLGALSGPVLTTSTTASPLLILKRFPLVLAYNWLNLLIFDLANQRESGEEDAINKPNRPIPSGRLTAVQMRRMLLGAIPVVLAVSYFLDVWQETAGLICLTWMYNDLGGGSENFIMRNVIIAPAFGLYNLGSLRVACGPGIEVTTYGYCWTAGISAVILTTMQIQDLKDQEGDRVIGRSTAPLVLGDMVARWTIAVPVLFSSILCPLYIGVDLIGFVAPCCLGLLVAARTLTTKLPKEDRRSWQVWALWLISLYVLPLVKDYSAVKNIRLY